jgi:hypothetical protein
MKVEDLRSLSQIGQALWVDPRLSRLRTAEALEAVGLLQIQDARILERVSGVLLARAMRENELIIPSLLSDPFYRLQPEERFLLAALHLERWSYQRLSRVLGGSVDQVATRAWRLRVHLASQGSSPRRPLASLGAAGAAASRPNCPEFDALNPWTQRFLDEELQSRERLFLQNHLMACADCRSALNRCRDLYYQVESMVPRGNMSDDAQEDGLEGLQETYRRIRTRMRPSETTWRDAGRAFLRQTEIQLLIAGLLTWFVWRLF